MWRTFERPSLAPFQRPVTVGSQPDKRRVFAGRNHRRPPLGPRDFYGEQQRVAFEPWRNVRKKPRDAANDANEKQVQDDGDG